MTEKNTDGLTEFGYWSRHCAAGGLSAAVSKTVSAPLDRIRMHMQVSVFVPAGPWHIIFINGE